MQKNHEAFDVGAESFAVMTTCNPWADDGRAVLDAVCAVFLELRDFVNGLSDDQYLARRSGQSTIGRHVRHCIDHAVALLNGLDGGVVNYDARRRGTSIEFDRSTALQRLTDLVDKLGRIKPGELGRVLAVDCLLTSSGPVVRTRSTLARELVFVRSHTIHHNATVAILAKELRAFVPGDFGLAPATIAFQRQQQACAP